MSGERLTDEQVAWHADPDFRARNARLSLTAEQYQAEQDALAREVQEWRAMRCDTCKHYVPKPDIVRGFCHPQRMTVLPAWFCADYTPKEAQP